MSGAKIIEGLKNAVAIARGEDQPGRVTIVQRQPPKPAEGEAWGILNPWGDVWTYDVFNSPEAATAYVKRFWGDNRSKVDLNAFKPVRVTITVAVADEQPGPNPPARP